MSKNVAGAERRRAKRRPVLESFSLFVVIPKKGAHRLPVYDLSDLGMRFEIDMAAEELAEASVSSGERLDVHLYLNQSLFLPLEVTVVRLEEEGSARRVGAEFSDKNHKGYRAFLSFLQMLDGISEEARLQS